MPFSFTYGYGWIRALCPSKLFSRINIAGGLLFSLPARLCYSAVIASRFVYVRFYIITLQWKQSNITSVSSSSAQIKSFAVNGMCILDEKHLMKFCGKRSGLFHPFERPEVYVSFFFLIKKSI